MDMSHDQSRVVLDMIPALVWTAQPDGSIEFLNRRWLEYAGLSAAQMQNWDWTMAIHPDDRALATKRWGVSLQNRVAFDAVLRILGADGVYRWFHASGHPARNSENRIVQLYCLSTDIDDQKRAEESLRASEQNFRLILDSIPGLVFTRTSAGGPEFVNQRTRDYYGEALDEVMSNAAYLGKDRANWSEFLHPDDREQVVTRWQHSVETGEPLEVTHRVRRRDGAIAGFNHESILSGTPTVASSAGTPCLPTSMISRKQKKNCGRMRLLLDAQRLSHTGGWIHNFASGKVTISPEVARIWGIEPGDDASAAEFFFARMHPEDRLVLEHSYEAAIFSKSDLDQIFGLFFRTAQ